MSREELELVLSAVVPTARHLLELHGKVRPFGAGLARGVSVEAIEASSQVPPDDFQRALESVTSRLKTGAMRATFRAVAICADVQVDHPDGGPCDAVRVHLEHRSGDVMDVFLPYLVHPDGRVEYGTLMGGDSELSIFEPA